MLTKVELNVEVLKKYCTLIPDEYIELELIPMFKLYYFKENEEPIVPFTNIVLKKLYNDNLDRDYWEISTFYKETQYLTTVMNFLSRIEILLLSKINKPIINNITFSHYDNSIAVFNIH